MGALHLKASIIRAGPLKPVAALFLRAGNIFRLFVLLSSRPAPYATGMAIGSEKHNKLF